MKKLIAIVIAAILAICGILLYRQIHDSERVSVAVTSLESTETSAENTETVKTVSASAASTSEAEEAVSEEVASSSMGAEEAKALEAETVEAESEDNIEDAGNAGNTEGAGDTGESTSTVCKGYVAIDPGHQGPNVDMSAQEPIAPGSSQTKMKATGGTTGRYTGVPEYQLALDISLQLRDLLESQGYTVILTREDNDTAISNAERAQLANEAGADIMVRIHANGSDSSSVNGACALIPGEDNPYVSYLAADSRDLAEAVLTSYCEATGMANQGITTHSDMTGINWSEIPVMILEMGYMTNQTDDTNMQDPAYQEKMVSGIADGIAAYYELHPSEYAASLQTED